MRRFSLRLFLYVLPIAIGLAIVIALGVIIDVSSAPPSEITIGVIVALAAAFAFAALVASYRYPARLAIFVYRGMLRGAAKRAIRSSLKNALTPVACLGILNRRGTAMLRLGVGVGSGVLAGDRFNVYDAVNDELWGRVEAVEVEDITSVCESYDRTNPE